MSTSCGDDQWCSLFRHHNPMSGDKGKSAHRFELQGDAGAQTKAGSLDFMWLKHCALHDLEIACTFNWAETKIRCSSAYRSSSLAMPSQASNHGMPDASLQWGRDSCRSKQSAPRHGLRLENLQHHSTHPGDKCCSKTPCSQRRICTWYLYSRMLSCSRDSRPSDCQCTAGRMSLLSSELCRRPFGQKGCTRRKR